MHPQESSSKQRQNKALPGVGHSANKEGITIHHQGKVSLTQNYDACHMWKDTTQWIIASLVLQDKYLGPTSKLLPFMWGHQTVENASDI